MIDSVKKASMTNKGRVIITEELVNDTLIKYQKTVQEMIDTCPANRPEKLAEYEANLTIVKEFAPQLITDELEIEKIIRSLIPEENLTKKNRGSIMKIVVPELKGKCDMKLVNTILGKILEN